MIRRLFNCAAAASLLVFLLSLTIAIWATLHNDVRAVARHGMLVSVGRKAGDLFITTMPWRGDEPLVLVGQPLTRYGIASGMGAISIGL